VIWSNEMNRKQQQQQQEGFGNGEQRILLIVEANFETRLQLESTLEHTQVAGALAAIPAGPDVQLTAEANLVPATRYKSRAAYLDAPMEPTLLSWELVSPT